jgi:CHAD domain-containing protein
MDDPRAVVHSLRRRSLGPIQPVKAPPAHVTRSMRPEDAFRATLLDCLAQITANAAALRSGRSVGGLHQLRVGFRRLDAALDSFGKEFGQAWLEELRGRAKVLTDRFSPARDLDVFVEKLEAAPKWGAAEGLPQLVARAEAARDEAWKKVGACLASTDFEGLVDDVAALASSQLPLSRDKRLPRAARRMLDRQRSRVKKRGKRARSGKEGDLHRLRIGLKKLRYTSEFFAPLYPKKKVGRYLKQLRALQNQLGDLNDVANMRSVVDGLMREKRKKDGVAAYAAGVLVGWYGAQAPGTAKAALKRYAKFKKVTPFWR